jgi:hypothetical protein
MKSAALLGNNQMARRLKVYGGHHLGRYRAVIAAHNAQEVADAIGNASAYYVRGYWSTTGNDTEIAAAMAQPGVLLVEYERNTGKYEPKRR